MWPWKPFLFLTKGLFVFWQPWWAWQCPLGQRSEALWNFSCHSIKERGWKQKRRDERDLFLLFFEFWRKRTVRSSWWYVENVKARERDKWRPYLCLSPTVRPMSWLTIAGSVVVDLCFTAVELWSSWRPLRPTNADELNFSCFFFC